jgi:CheY-like chemotaxis protein
MPNTFARKAGNMLQTPVPATSTATLLVVDDDRDIRQLIADSLGARGYRVETAANAREMDQVLARMPVDLIILDVMMPGEDGLSACRRIARDDGPEIVLLSALGEEHDRILGLEVGAGFSGCWGVWGASAVGFGGGGGCCFWGWGCSGGMRRTTSPLATAAGFALDFEGSMSAAASAAARTTVDAAAG